TAQADPALELVLRLFSRPGLERVRAAMKPAVIAVNQELQFFLEAYSDYASTVDQAVSYLQGRAPELAKKIAARELLPEGPRFVPLQEKGPLLDQFLSMPLADRAQHLASLYLDDLADYVKIGCDPRFEFSRYGEKLAASAPSFDSLARELARAPTVVDEILEEITLDLLRDHQPDVVGISVPFSGTVYGAFRMGALLREREIPVLLGGGYCNTELRRLEDARVFDFVDFITLDDGERPLLCLLEFFAGRRERKDLFRTFYREEGKVVFAKSAEKDIPFPESGTPTYVGLPVQNYVKMFEMLNPVNRLWSGFFWNKLTLAHGCYWRKCSFCDTSLDYIGRYEAGKATALVDKMVKISLETGSRGFHFVDEAAPPAILKALSEEIIRRGLQFEWWGNIRFDKTFTPELTALMKKAGCVAVTGGLEVASPRVLALIDKGVTVEQVARVTRAFHQAGVFVHAYLMYGFPTQTVQETVDSLEVVRQLFAEKCLQSGFWHRFSATVHSPVGRDPARFGIEVREPRLGKHGRFAENDLDFEDPTAVDHDALGVGLRRALYNFMHGQGVDNDVREWFPGRVPKTRVPAKLIADAL
ncbi:MAG: B12-binding domain-containing radical SAM protein, partial [Bdellovibrionota bacterium]